MPRISDELKGFLDEPEIEKPAAYSSEVKTYTLSPEELAKYGPVNTKRCLLCGEAKPLLQYDSGISGKRGLDHGGGESQCGPCVIRILREYRRQNNGFCETQSSAPSASRTNGRTGDSL